MSVNARYLCNTCMTICYADGARVFLKNKDITAHEVYSILTKLDDVRKNIYIDEEDVLEGRLKDLAKWLARHKGHEILLTNENALDMITTEAYKTETVDGEVNPLTGEEEAEKLQKDMRGAEKKRIVGIMKKHIGLEHAEAIAEEIVKNQVFY